MVWTCPIIEKNFPHPSLCVLRVEKPESLSFQAGQYAFLSLSQEHDDLTRPYSIASRPQDDFLEFHVRDSYIPQGLSHQIIHQTNSDHSLFVHNIAGTVRFNPAKNDPCLMIAGGTGIAPIQSMIQTHVEILQRQVSVFWGMGKEEELYLSNWIDFCHQHPSISLTLCLEDMTPNTLPCETGLVGDVVINNFKDISKADVYVFGPPAMVDHTIKALLKTGQKPKSIHSDIPF